MPFISQLLEHPSLLAYFSGANNYTWLQFRNGERRLLAKPLTYFEAQLPTFIRVHKTALVNPSCVTSVQHPARTKMSGFVLMYDGVEFPVSRRRWNDVLRLLQTHSETAPTGSLNGAERKPTQRVPYVSPPLVMLAVMTGDAVLLTRDCLAAFSPNCLLHSVESGAELANALLFSPARERPALILLDARTNRSDRILTLRALKSHAQLRAIPVIWLAAPGDDTMPVYALDANSVVVVPDDPALFIRTIEQLCRYWLGVVQLPPERETD